MTVLRNNALKGGKGGKEAHGSFGNCPRWPRKPSTASQLKICRFFKTSTVAAPGFGCLMSKLGKSRLLNFTLSWVTIKKQHINIYIHTYNNSIYIYRVYIYIDICIRTCMCRYVPDSSGLGWPKRFPRTAQGGWRGKSCPEHPNTP